MRDIGLVNADQAVHSDVIEPVEENPLGYPMGEAGASGVTPMTPRQKMRPSVARNLPARHLLMSGTKESNLLTIIVVAAAAVLVGAAIAVWLVFRGRGRKRRAAETGAFNPGNGPGPRWISSNPLRRNSNMPLR